MSSVFSASIAILPAGSSAASAVQQEQPAQGQLGQGHATSTVTCVSNFAGSKAVTFTTTGFSDVSMSAEAFSTSASTTVASNFTSATGSGVGVTSTCVSIALISVIGSSFSTANVCISDKPGNAGMLVKDTSSISTGLILSSASLRARNPPEQLSHSSSFHSS